MIFHLIALLLGFLFDLLIGDPDTIPHPVRLIGHLIAFIEKRTLNDNDSQIKKSRAGLTLVISVCFFTLLFTGLIMTAAYRISPYVGCAVEAVLTCYALAAKSLKTESMKVYKALDGEGLDAGRRAVSMIVGRDTAALTKEGVIKAAVETVAENTSDGVIAPMFYLAIGGPLLGLLYKAVNTMDSMVGYKNDKYLDYGFWAAKLDDIVNFIPARVSAYLMILSAYILPGIYNGSDAKRIYKRDRYNHASPNSAQTEAACAGALGLKLAGPAYYFGKLYEKPYIGDEKRKIETEDIKRANNLMYATAALALLIFMIMLFIANLFIN